MSIHFIYVQGTGISTPRAITNELSARLSRYQHDLKVYDWAEETTIYPKEGDILIGHPHPRQNTIFRNSFFNESWTKRIVFCPFQHAIPKYFAYLDPYIEHCDRFLAICGQYWEDTLPKSIFSHWQAKLTRIDLAINPSHFPFIKESFNPPSNRKFLYIGNTMDYKACNFLIQLANANPHLKIGWIGAGEMPCKSIAKHGALNFEQSSSHQIVAEYDFLLTCGKADPNPTTILEGASWGLIPICTPQSGYYESDWIFNIPLFKLGEASKKLNSIAEMTSENLKKMQQAAQQQLARHYNWDRFAQDVISCIEQPETPVRLFPVDSETEKHRRTLNAASNQHPFLPMKVNPIRRLYWQVKRFLPTLGSYSAS